MEIEMIPNEKKLIGQKMIRGDLAVRDNLQLVNKANQIIKSYQQKIKNEEWKKSKEKELGKFPTGKKIKVDDSFTSADQIRAYDFGDAFNTREAIWGIYDQIGQEVTVINATKNVNAEIAQDIRGIKNLMLEVNDVQNQFREVQNKVNEINDAMERMREGFNNNLRILQSNIERVGAQGASSGEIAVIKSRLATLEDKISSGNYGSGSSAGSSSNAGEIKARLNSLLEELRGNLSSLRNITQIKTAMNQKIDLLKEKENLLKEQRHLENENTRLETIINSQAKKDKNESRMKAIEEKLALITATTNKGDLVIDPCVGSFIVLEVCQELKRDYLGVDLTFQEMGEYLETKN
ncbi:11239_t:CDS:2 [Racocetra fulgida]|uniref:11239_t:CDS:1 n=1 Tax=Racocetra fulgida TaxID=60492 RepID=A0A9N8VGS0_9GLOM|nr:11239_t:CDS:2 [Racocetra fulgida]